MDRFMEGASVPSGETKKTRRPFVLVTVSGGIAEAEGYDGADYAVIDWDSLPGESMDDEQLREALAEARDSIADLPDAERRKGLMDQFEEIQVQYLSTCPQCDRPLVPVAFMENTYGCGQCKKTWHVREGLR